VVAKLPVDRPDRVSHALKGRILAASTAVYLREAFPTVTNEGLAFAREVVVITEGEKIMVEDAKILSTEKDHFGQIWLKVSKPEPAQ
jgi:hypothetical protein